jgi:hypothetical protein
MLHSLFFVVQILLFLYQISKSLKNNFSTRNVSFLYIGEKPSDTKARYNHRGEPVREIVDKSKFTIGEIGERIGRTRTGLYSNL